MRTLQGQSTPLLLPPQENTFSILNTNINSVLLDDVSVPEQSNDIRQPDNAHTLCQNVPVYRAATRLSSEKEAAPPQDQVLASAHKRLSLTTQQPMNILTLLATADAPLNNQQPIWSVKDLSSPCSGDFRRETSQTSSKRSLEDTDDNDRRTKIRRTGQQHEQPGEPHATSMTTVICMHAAVAQKSYGNEKRFLCPPPIVRIEGLLAHAHEQQLSMSIFSQNSDNTPRKSAPLDNKLTADFRSLYVAGTGKSKSFQLLLEIAHLGNDFKDIAGRPRPWATFESAPVTIMSKPKRIAKMRDISSCIIAGGPVSLFNRINSQTVRTKYMTIDEAHLCASNMSWSVFNMVVLRQPQGTGPVVGPQPVTYGSEIILSDSISGITTGPLIIRKVEKGKISMDTGEPVTHMQKISLHRVDPDGSRHYLSAIGSAPDTPGAVAAPTAPGMASQANTCHLTFQAPRTYEEIKDGVRTVTDEADNFLSWSIVGISKFQYTFSNASRRNKGEPDLPITPFPTLFAAPIYHPTDNTVEMSVSNFFYENTRTGHPSALEVWLGDMGPLVQRIYSAPHPGPLTSTASYAEGESPRSGGHPRASDNADALSSGTSLGPTMCASRGAVHNTIVVELPPIMGIVRALQDEAKRLEDSIHPTAGASGGDAGPFEVKADIPGRVLPLLFIRSCDGVRYHSGRSVTMACEDVFQHMGLSSNTGNGTDMPWLASVRTVQTAGVDGAIRGWTVRVL